MATSANLATGRRKSSAARLAPADFLALDLARVARDEAGSAKRFAQL